MITELKARDIEKNLKTVKNLATYNVGITNSHNIIIVNLCLSTFTGLDFLDNFALTSVVFCFLDLKGSYIQILRLTEAVTELAVLSRKPSRG